MERKFYGGIILIKILLILYFLMHYVVTILDPVYVLNIHTIKVIYQRKQNEGQA